MIVDSLVHGKQPPARNAALHDLDACRALTSSRARLSEMTRKLTAVHALQNISACPRLFLSRPIQLICRRSSHRQHHFRSWSHVTAMLSICRSDCSCTQEGGYKTQERGCKRPYPEYRSFSDCCMTCSRPQIRARSYMSSLLSSETRGRSGHEGAERRRVIPTKLTLPES